MRGETESDGTMSRLSQDEIDALQTSGLHTKTPFMMRGVGSGMFCVARFYGRAVFNGDNYTYFYESDELVRDDVLAWLAKRAQPKRRKARKL